MSNMSFVDVKKVMDAALLDPKGVAYRLKTYGQAVNFRHRCYKFRTLERTMEAKRVEALPGILPTDKYGTLVIRLAQPLSQLKQKKEEFDLTKPVFVVFKHLEAVGDLFTLDGEEIAMPEDDITVEEDFDLPDISDYKGLNLEIDD